ncbi:sulfite exporter TauE/SafE family protein [Oscillochloris sp. ZM17-4]|uniref:sulfite exporter TauE/SafE family protein n=1 Tax=Oscillochloris sp. ZM17-4 TaxID=2866714 RepID=UPI001C731838|nr:sulfite exporter TauE/SafE family protein [Oscillochloris sp. ZM17-4]MBX0327736.1 sulfite exporter TauE/SafE family protein [Oscillochloris sp. ZM17-4]
MLTLLLGGLVVLGAALLGGITGFGFALVCTPLLLSLGVPLPVVVISNLSLATATRISVAYRLRAHIDVGRVAWLVAASVPGILLGTWVIAWADPRAIKLAAGALVIVAVLLILRSMARPAPARIPGSTGLAGFLAGFLGSTTSLNGIPPVLLLARDRVSPKGFQANLALFFISSNLITLAVLAARGAPFAEALIPRGLIWLPVALAGNLAGVRLGTSLPDLLFRRIALAVAFVAGVLAMITA